MSEDEKLAEAKKEMSQAFRTLGKILLGLLIGLAMWSWVLTLAAPVAGLSIGFHQAVILLLAVRGLGWAFNGIRVKEKQ